MLDGWLGEAPTEGRLGALSWRRGAGGLAAEVAIDPSGVGDEAVREAARCAYTQLFEFLDGERLHLIRARNRVPAGRQRAFERGRDQACAARGALAAATTVGDDQALVRVEGFAAVAEPVHVPGATVHEWGGRRFLFSSAQSSPAGGLAAQVRAIIEALRGVTSHDRLAAHGIDVGFRVEDLVEARIYHRRDEDRPELERLLRRHLAEDGRFTFARAEPLDPDALVELDAIFEERSGAARPAYRRQADGRVRIEAFELHVVEHCNLRCAHCCNMSPYLDRHFMSVAEIDAQCRRMARHVKADIFKIMGGEPLLHPEITAILGVLRATGISDVIRLFTNGLLLARMPDDFWRALDHLTVSSYSSAPVKPADLAFIRDKARELDVVLNFKPVDRFSRVMSAERHSDDGVMQTTYDECWLRHRCLIVRGGAFYKCTRSAYFKEFQERMDVPERHPDPASVLLGDGIPLDAPDFDARLLAYLNDTRPLESCRYCLGSSGPMEPHSQLTRLDVRRGRL